MKFYKLINDKGNGNAEDDCMELPPEVMQKEILELSSPDLLHIGKLGPPNDVMDHMFQVDTMEKFYYDCGLDERATMYNNHLVGKDVDKVWKEENLVRLLPFPNGDKIIAFLRAVRELTEPQVASPPPSLSTLQRMWPTSRGSWQRPERGSLPH